MALIV